MKIVEKYLSKTSMCCSRSMGNVTQKFNYGLSVSSPLGVYTLVGWAGDLTCGGLNPGGGALNGSGDASSSSTYNTKCDSMVTAALSGTGHARNLNNNQHFSFSNRSGLLSKTSSPLPLGFSPCYSQVCGLASLVPMFLQN